MILTAPTPWQAALDLLRGRELLPTTLSAQQLEAVGAELRRGAMFSARVQNASVLQRALDLVGQIADPTTTGQTPGSYMDRARAREEMRKLLAGIGYSAEAEGVTPGSLRDLTSEGRLNLIVDTNVEMLQGQARAVQGNDPDLLDAFPCMELVRLSNWSAVSRGTARNWPQRWADGGGKFYAGRMIARKDDPVWTDPAFNRFGQPWAPFDYNSGMGTRDIARAEAVRLGVMQLREPPPAVRPLREVAGIRPQASVASLDPQVQRSLADALGNAFEIADGVLREKGGQ
mgnify:CR=1 FL=1